MPLEIYQRGRKWWVRGRTDGLDGYINRSLGTSDEAVAAARVREIERKARQRAILGEDAPKPEDELTFSQAVLLYDAKPAEAKFLIKIIPHLGETRVRDIKPKAVRDLGRLLYPNAAADTWRRQVVTPVAAVINNAHDLGKCAPIRIRAYTADERINQDRERGKLSRQEKTAGSWAWLDRFRKHANDRLGALALFSFTTGARIGQCIEMKREEHLDLKNGRALIPPAKGHTAQWVNLFPEVVAALANLEVKNSRVFGYQHRWSVYKPWKKACQEAGIEYIPPHAAGRHGFGTELIVRQRLDPVTVAREGRWSSPAVPLNTYAHASDSSQSVHDAFSRGKEAKSAKPKQSGSGSRRKILE